MTDKVEIAKAFLTGEKRVKFAYLFRALACGNAGPHNLKVLDDLCRRSDVISFPLWHNEVLTEREQALLSGESVIEDWETAKVRIKELVS